MALTVDLIQAALKKRGLNEKNAEHFTFETEAQMNTVLDSFVHKPKTYATPEDLIADEALKPLVMQYGDKRVGEAQKKWDKDHKTGSSEPSKPEELATLISTSIQEAIKPFTEKVNQLETAKAKEIRTAKIQKMVAAELPVGVHDLVIRAISDDMDDAAITTFIGEQKAKLTEAGLKEIGVPGGGGNGGGGGAAKQEIETWGEAKGKASKKSLETKKQ